MNFTLLKASSNYLPVFNNLMQFYYYDFSEYLGFDTDKNGLYEPYPGLADYWEKDSGKFLYLLQDDEHYLGFVLVKMNHGDEGDFFSIAEFFVLKKYRLNGIGKAVAVEVFNLHRGRWQVHQKESNKPAQLFWRKTISAYTVGKFTEHIAGDRIIQSFDNSLPN